MAAPDNEIDASQIHGTGPTFEAALARAVASHPKSDDLLALAAFFAPGTAIPIEAVPASAMTAGEVTAAFDALRMAGLAAAGGRGGGTVTAAVQQAMRDRLEKSGDAPRTVARAVRALAEAYPHGLDDPGDAGNWGRCAALEPHVMAALEHAPDTGPDAVATRQLLRQHAPYLFSRGRHAGAEALLRRAGAIGEVLWGPDHPNGAQDRTDLAILLNDMGRTEEALPLVRRAMVIDEAAFGPEHPLVAERYNILATLLANLGRPAEADPFIRHAVLAAERSLGSDHPDTKLYRENYEAIIASIDAIARRDEAVEAGLVPAPPERLQRPDIPPPPVRDRPLLERLRQRRPLR